jgi:DNA-binding transcriptional LysR family regulator
MGKIPRPPDNSPTVEDLRYFLKLWEAAKLIPRNGMKIGAATVERFAVDELGISSRPNPAKEVEKIGEYFGREFFQSQGYAPNPDCFELVAEIEECLRHLDRYTNRGSSAIRLRLGVGHSVSMSLAPKIVGRFRRKLPQIDVEIVVDNSISLRKKHERLEIDVVLSALPPSYDTSDAFHKVNLEPALIVRRHHPIAQKFRESEDLFLKSGLLEPASVIHIFEGQQPAIPVSRMLQITERARFVQQSSYALVNELVAQGDDFGITLPHLLTSAQWRRVQVIPIQEPAAQLTLLSVETSASAYTKLMDSQLDEKYLPALQLLTHIAKEEMNALVQISENYQKAPAVTYECFVDMPMKANLLPDDNKYVRKWLRGKFKQHRGDNKNFVGEFELNEVLDSIGWIAFDRLKPPRKEIRGTIEGTIDLAEGGQLQDELVVSQGSNSETGEQFCVTFVRRCYGKDFKWPAVGLWLGRQNISLPDRFFDPALGYFVIRADSNQEVTKEMLNDWTLGWNSTAFLPTLFAPPASSSAIQGPHTKSSHVPGPTSRNE